MDCGLGRGKVEIRIGPDPHSVQAWPELVRGWLGIDKLGLKLAKGDNPNAYPTIRRGFIGRARPFWARRLDLFHHAKGAVRCN